MKVIRTVPGVVLVVGLLGGLWPASPLSAQVIQEVFSEDFSGATINPDKFQPDAPFFEGGVGDIAARQESGVLVFDGVVSEQWWAGATLRVVPTFEATEEQHVAVSVDRVLEGGQGTASRSALWIMDETQTRYVLFADVRGEGGWRFNRKIGEAGDVPTGGGTDILAFNGTAPNGLSWDDGSLRRMKAVANGSTVRLYLDEVFGAEVRFPFQDYVFHVGSYARANNDVAYTEFDNLLVETIGVATFAQTGLTLPVGQTSFPIAVRVPEGANVTSPVQMRVVSDDPAIAVPVGGTGGTLTLTFATGGPRSQTIEVQSVGGTGGAQLTLENDIGLTVGNPLVVTVIEGPGVRLSDDFAAGALDSAKWQINNTPFEANGLGSFTVNQSGGVLTINGVVQGDPNVNFWPGAAVRSVSDFTATEDLPLSVRVDRVSVDPVDQFDILATGARTGIFLTTPDRSRFVFFGQNIGFDLEGNPTRPGWHVNVNPGNPTGDGTSIPVFDALDLELGSHQLQMIADGENVEVLLDGVSGGTFPFAASAGIHVEIGAFARAEFDEVEGVFDNLLVENTLPCLDVVPTAVSAILGQPGDPVTVTIPSLLNTVTPATVTVTSRNPEIAVPTGAVGGSLTLQFAAGGPTSQSFSISPVGAGTTVFDLASDPEVCVTKTVEVLVTSTPVILFSDDFSGGTIDTADWSIIDQALNATTPGTATADSAVTVENQAVQMEITAETAEWPGFGLATVQSFSASPTSPITFEVDRVSLGFQLVTGTSAKQRTGVWISDSARTRYVFFNEYATHDGTAGGWQFNRAIGLAGDTPLPAAGGAIPAFAPAVFNDRGNHRMKVIVDGSNAKLYLNGVFGATVPFPVSEGIVFGMGSYVQAATDRVTGTFDNVVISGTAPSLGSLSVVQQANGDLVINWAGAGVLQSASTLTGPNNWNNVTPAPGGNSYTIAPAAQAAQMYYRLQQ